MTIQKTARFSLGQVVQSRTQPLQGVVLDADAMCAVPLEGDIETDQPFYQVFAFGEGGGFVAYMPEEALIPAGDGASPLAWKMVAHLRQAQSWSGATRRLCDGGCR